MNHNGFTFKIEPARDAGDVLTMVHKLLESGKSYKALAEIERWMCAKALEKDVESILGQYDAHMANPKIEAIHVNNEPWEHG